MVDAKLQEIETVKDSDQSTADVAQWTVFLCWHDQKKIVPVYKRLLKGQKLEVNRKAKIFQEALEEDERVSRTHALFIVDQTGSLGVIDDGSKNGVFVNGERVVLKQLRPTDVVQVGGALFVVGYTQERAQLANVPELPGISNAIASVRERASQLVTQSANLVWLCGELGTNWAKIGKYFYHCKQWSDPFILVERTNQWESAWSKVKSGVIQIRRARDMPKAFLNRVVTTVLAQEQAGQKLVLVDWLAKPTERIPHDPQYDPIFVRDGVERFEIPPLRVRPEDIPLLIEQKFTSREQLQATIDQTLMTRLLRDSWQGNESQLGLVIDALIDGNSQLDIETILHESLEDSGENDIEKVPEVTNKVIEVNIDGKWFTSNNGELIDLIHRPMLMRVLSILANHYVKNAEQPIDVEALSRETWPEMKFIEDSAATRVYATISILRRMGLREVITRDENGYRLGPSHLVSVIS